MEKNSKKEIMALTLKQRAEVLETCDQKVIPDRCADLDLFLIDTIILTALFNRLKEKKVWIKSKGHFTVVLFR